MVVVVCDLRLAPWLHGVAIHATFAPTTLALCSCVDGWTSPRPMFCSVQILKWYGIPYFTAELSAMLASASLEYLSGGHNARGGSLNQSTADPRAIAYGK